MDRRSEWSQVRTGGRGKPLREDGGEVGRGEVGRGEIWAGEVASTVALVFKALRVGGEGLRKTECATETAAEPIGFATDRQASAWRTDCRTLYHANICLARVSQSRAANPNRSPEYVILPERCTHDIQAFSGAPPKTMAIYEAGCRT